MMESESGGGANECASESGGSVNMGQWNPEACEAGLSEVIVLSDWRKLRFW
ncbi:MAG: hypothetical protein K2G53_06180 [Muribaculaceae bacterium]|nr:hypothetical protein [Muribaculaceae bacterium]